NSRPRTPWSRSSGRSRPPCATKSSAPFAVASPSPASWPTWRVFSAWTAPRSGRRSTRRRRPGPRGRRSSRGAGWRPGTGRGWGSGVAGEERRRLGIGFRALGDVSELLEGEGVRTALVDLPEEVSGLTLMEPRLSLFVIANRRHPLLRRRFSWVHEYAHVLFD